MSSLIDNNILHNNTKNKKSKGKCKMKKNYNTNNKQKNIKIDNERVYTDNKKEKNYDDQIE